MSKNKSIKEEESDWEKDWDKTVWRLVNKPYFGEVSNDVKQFIKNLLSQQRKKIRENVEFLESDKEFEDSTHFQNGFEHAIQKVLLVLKE